jgi:hypothetical protein
MKLSLFWQMPQVASTGGQTVMVMVRNGRVLASGRWPLLLRAMVNRRYLKGRR